MPTSSSSSQHASPATRPRSLLGAYPVPELRLVGAPGLDRRKSPVRWQPTPPPVQYGIDYKFTHLLGGEPVRWPSGSAVTVRIAGPAREDRTAALARVVAELVARTRLNLVTGEPGRPRLVCAEIPDGEIHVGYLTVSELASVPGDACGHAGTGHASRCLAGCCYVRGFAIVNADLAGPEATAEHALAILRHELCHCLGLGHAARPSQLMHRNVAARTTRYERGDLHGLALVGHAPRP